MIYFNHYSFRFKILIKKTRGSLVLNRNSVHHRPIMHLPVGVPRLSSSGYRGHNGTCGHEAGELSSRVRGLNHCGVLHLRQGGGRRASLLGPRGRWQHLEEGGRRAWSLRRWPKEEGGRQADLSQPKGRSCQQAEWSDSGGAALGSPELLTAGCLQGGRPGCWAWWWGFPPWLESLTNAEGASGHALFLSQTSPEQAGVTLARHGFQ